MRIFEVYVAFWNDENDESNTPEEHHVYTVAAEDADGAGEAAFNAAQTWVEEREMFNDEGEPTGKTEDVSPAYLRVEQVLALEGGPDLDAVQFVGTYGDGRFGEMP